MEWTAKKCETVLSSCSTSIDEDLQLLRIINRIQDWNEEDSFSRAIRDEIRAFKVPAKKRSISRWKLGVEWRYRYKMVLSDCISYCAKMLDNLNLSAV